ncbi:MULTISPECIES: HpcH/HpaI aldolase/citrate lyase family protein [Microbacterium]|jgi:citrate lyase subunit beta / citryl-CoA lyase|uniref:HpcH/HpaI aldolase/citrate lyase family protein n=1 Tax=Microbacterium TaxID=33882 RepID=UPI0010F71355|nr:aldolase/citrate lyase family protein [Microbacterium sp. 4NA327F11]MCK9915339.1 aldolase/citrate lyase family protein [Microbacteriaceae bacterium K1510]
MSVELPGPALLFCPADRPDRFAKAAERADGVILDLEDAVAAADRPAARAALAAADLDPDRTIVRVNPVGTADHVADLVALATTPFRTLMVAKAASAAALATIDIRYRLIPLCETARGVIEAESLATLPTVIGLMWGAEDLVASLGGTSSRARDGRYRDVARHSRSRVLLAAGAYGLAAVDAVHIDIDDERGLAEEARDAAASGFHATACIHPAQVAVVRAAYAPTVEEVARARAVLAAAEDWAGVFAFDGAMVDEPLLRHARAVVARAGG